MTDTQKAPTRAEAEPPDHVADAEREEMSRDRTLLERIRSHLPDNFKAEAESKGVDWVVFAVVAALAVAFVIWGFAGTESLATVSTSALGWVMNATGWAFVLTASFFVVFVLWLAMSKFGNIPLGRDGEKPAFKTWSWISMMFAAGMGIGLMFYGVNEPLTFFADTGDYAIPGSDGLSQAELAERAMASTMLMFESHWMPLATPDTAENTNATVRTAMMPTSTPLPTSPMPPTI